MVTSEQAAASRVYTRKHRFGPYPRPWLKGIDLSRTNLQRAYLRNANLEGATLWGAHFEGANLTSAHFEGAVLWYAHLQGAELVGANLEGTDLRVANLEGADLRSANLENADVSGVTYDRKGRCKGIRVATCHGSQRFKRHAMDQDYIEEFRNKD